MKRGKNLYKEIIDPITLRVAAHFASRGKKNRKTVKHFFEREDKKIKLLHDLLESEAYYPLPYNRKTIMDKCTNKIREIFVPRFFPDQIVQWALMLEIHKFIKRGMYDYCCASVERRGAGLGIKTIKKWITRDPKNTKYCLVCDIKKFYPSIDQAILKRKFEKIIKDKQTLNLIEKIIHSVPSGVPIGNYTSQWFANYFLQDFDHFVKEKLKIKYYIRYMDDMVFFSSNKRELHRQFWEIKKFLEKENLTLKPNWQIFKLADKKGGTGRPLDFLGYKFYRNYTTMRGKTFLRTTRRLRKIAQKTYLTAADAAAALSYNARIKYTSGQRFYLKFLRPCVNIKACRLTVSRHDKKAAAAAKAESDAISESA